MSYRGLRRRTEKERHWEHFWGDDSWKLPQHGTGNSQLSLTQDKPWEKDAETTNNQANRY